MGVVVADDVSFFFSPTVESIRKLRGDDDDVYLRRHEDEGDFSAAAKIR